MFSTEAYTVSFTGWLLSALLELLRISVSPATFHLIHTLARKAAHTTEYAIFAMLIYGSIGGGKNFAWRARRAVLCVAMAAIYSLTDEFHQSLVPGRTPSLLDCTIDTAGATLGVYLLFVRDRFLHAKQRRPAAMNESAAET